MSRVDAHHHIWDLTVREQTWMVGPELDPIRRNFSIDDLAPQAAAAGITAAVLVQTVSLVDETVEFLDQPGHRICGDGEAIRVVIAPRSERINEIRQRRGIAIGVRTHIEPLREMQCGAA